MQLLFFALSLVFYYVLHSVLANTKVKTFLMERFIAQKYYRLLFNFTAVVLLFPIFYFYRKISTTYLFVNVLPAYQIGRLENIGLGIAALGMLLLLYALSQYNLSEFAGTQQLKNASPPTPESLKVSGFNSYVRHPLYFAGLLIIWGGFLFRPTDLYLVMGLVSTAYLYFGTKLEEEKLVVEFGEEYLEYQKRVGMLLPFWK